MRKTPSKPQVSMPHGNRAPECSVSWGCLQPHSLRGLLPSSLEPQGTCSSHMLTDSSLGLRCLVDMERKPVLALWHQEKIVHDIIRQTACRWGLGLGSSPNTTRKMRIYSQGWGGGDRVDGGSLRGKVLAKLSYQDSC